MAPRKKTYLQKQAAMMKAIKEPIVTAVATLKITVDALGMGAQWASKVWG